MKNVIFTIVVSIFGTSCNNCSEKDAIQEFKTTAWHSLIGPDTIWFPPPQEMQISGSSFGEYSCYFTTYGKKLGHYYECTLKRTIKCTVHGWRTVNEDLNSFSEVKDSLLIKNLEKTSSDNFIPTKRPGER